MSRAVAVTAPSRADALAILSPRLLLALMLPVSASVGAVLAHKLTLGAAMVLAIVYATIVLLNLPLALILYVPLTFLQAVKFPGVGPSAIGLLILAAWLSTSRSSFIGVREFLDRHGRLVAAILALLAWNAVTIAWAPDKAVAGATLGDWARAALLFFLLATTLRTIQDARWLMAAFIVGALIAILAGAATEGLQTAQKYDGRLTGGAGDPNYLAMELVAATILALALIVTLRRWFLRLLLILTLPVLAYGFASTQSRGGLLAGLAAALCALVLFRRKRLAVVAILGGVALLAAIWFVSNPTALSRVTSFDASGDGRSDLWTVALRVWHDHRLAGVGLNNFVAVEGQYVNRPGALTSVALIVDVPHVVHNTYLEALVDTGVLGLALLAGVFGGFVRVAVRAGRRAEAVGLSDVAVLARGVAVAIVAVLVALVFLSDAPDLRLWELFALAPITFRLAYRERVPARSRGPAPGQLRSVPART